MTDLSESIAVFLLGFITAMLIEIMRILTSKAAKRKQSNIKIVNAIYKLEKYIPSVERGGGIREIRSIIDSVFMDFYLCGNQKMLNSAKALNSLLISPEMTDVWRRDIVKQIQGLSKLAKKQ